MDGKFSATRSAWGHDPAKGSWWSSPPSRLIAAFVLGTVLLLGLVYRQADWGRPVTDVLASTNAESPAAVSTPTPSPATSRTLNRHSQQLLQDVPFFQDPRLFERRRLQNEELDLADMICDMPGIQDAAVSVSEVREKDLAGTHLVSASVVLKSQSGDPLTANWLHAMRALVAGRFPGLTPENVNIVDLTSGKTYLGPLDVAETSRLDELTYQQSKEEMWEQKIRRVLKPFGEEIEVVVNVEPASDTESVESERPWLGNDAASVHVRIFPHHVSDVASITQRKERYARLRETLESIYPGVRVDIIDYPWGLAARSLRSVHENPPWWSKPMSVRVAWGVAIGAAVCLIVWLMVTSLTSTSATHHPVRLPEPQPTSDRSVGNRADEGRRPNHDEQELVQRVGDLVRDDPDSAARIIQDWMRKAG